MVLSDGTEKTLSGSLSAGISGVVETPADVAVVSAYLSIDGSGAAAGVQIGLCDTGADSGSDNGDGGSGGETTTSPPAAEPVTGTPGFTG